MDFFELKAISPVDGRYKNKVRTLETYFSEYGLIKYRVFVEVEYFIALCLIPLPQLKSFPKDKIEQLRDINQNFAPEEAAKIKEIEKVTNHDVKAVEYYLKEKFEELGISSYKEYIHFGLTSQDINNTATPLSLKDALFKVYYPGFEELLDQLLHLSEQWKDIPMLARTHGQPASPTRLGKEIAVFAERLNTQYQMLQMLSFPAKFGGATGNFNAHHVAYPQVDWVTFANHFVNQVLGLKRSQTTTQIEHYDNLGAIFDNLKRINTILIDFARDIWMYISMEYFKQKIVKGEVGSSTMPHKVNPIDFENAEGNLGIANAIYEHLSAKLPISRLQRDLTDSTVLRNIGVPIAHGLIAIESLKKGLQKLLLNQEKIEEDLEKNWGVIAEAIQTILRRENYPNPYEALKDLTRQNTRLTQKHLKEFIDNLTIDERVKNELRGITPSNYLGIR